MIKNKHVCASESCFLCQTCLPEWGPAIQANRKQLSFRKGACIFREGEPVRGIYFLNSGMAKIHKYWNEDKELIIRFASAGDILGHRGLGEDPVYPVSATALTPLRVCFIDLAFFQASLRTNYPFMHGLLQSFAGDLQETEERMRDLAHMPVKGRVAQAILNLGSTLGYSVDGCVSFTLSRQDLASFAGTTYETVFRVLSDLLKDGLISISGKEIRIQDPEGLSLMSRQLSHATSAVPAPGSVSLQP
jgi:CRP/FNR family transcriptional regulator, cyclic AMP receptor protein